MHSYLILWLYPALDVGHRCDPAVAALRPRLVVAVAVVVLGEGGDLVIISGVVSSQPGQEAQGRGGGGLAGVGGSEQTCSGHTGLRPREGTFYQEDFTLSQSQCTEAINELLTRF